MGEIPTVACASMFAETVACIVRVPTEIIKQRRQVGMYTDRRLVSVARNILVTKGIVGLYQGLGATLLRDLPFMAIQFTIYETMRGYFIQNKDQYLGYKDAILGSISGFVAGAVTTPLDVIKTRTMLSASPLKSWGMIFRSGHSVLFSGIVPRSLSFGFGGFVFFGAYQFGSHLVQSRNHIACIF